MRISLLLVSALFTLQSLGFADLLRIYKGDSSMCFWLADTEDEQKTEDEKGADADEVEDTDDVDQKIILLKDAAAIHSSEDDLYIHFSVTLLPSFSQGLISPPPEA